MQFFDVVLPAAVAVAVAAATAAAATALGRGGVERVGKDMLARPEAGDVSVAGGGTHGEALGHRRVIEDVQDGGILPGQHMGRVLDAKVTEGEKGIN